MKKTFLSIIAVIISLSLAVPAFANAETKNGILSDISVIERAVVGSTAIEVPVYKPVTNPIPDIPAFEMPEINVPVYGPPQNNIPDVPSSESPELDLVNIGLVFKEGCNYTIDIENNWLLGVVKETNVAAFLDNITNPEDVKILDKDRVEVTDEDALITTGTVVQVVEEEVVQGEVNVVIIGDVNCDGRVNSRDLSALQRMISVGDYTNAMLVKAANVNGDEKVNSRDIAVLQIILVEG